LSILWLNGLGWLYVNILSAKRARLFDKSCAPDIEALSHTF